MSAEAICIACGRVVIDQECAKHGLRIHGHDRLQERETATIKPALVARGHA